MTPQAWASEALARAVPEVYWLADSDRPSARERLSGDERADLVVIGGGYSGLWAALRAKERDPGRDVVLVEAGHCGEQASGRNGGFASASLTHGFGNGAARWPDELAELDRQGAQNLAEMGETVRRYDIDCHWEETGELSVARAPHQVQELHELHEAMTAVGNDAVLLDRVRVQEQVASPTYLAGLWEPTSTVMVEPARLAWGLMRAASGHGVRIYEGTAATALESDGSGIAVHTAAGGRLHARQVVLATNAFPPLLRRLRLMTVPVYDYVLMTEPLTDAQLGSIGWRNRQGVGDSANMFHYYRLTRDNRILWGGYDAVYHYGSRIDPELEQQGGTHERLAAHFFETFPQLTGLRFTHRWAGVIDTSTRFNAFFGTAYAGRVGYALGFTGLGVTATRFGADVVLDLLSGEQTERTELSMVRSKPVPFPPEPLRYAGVQLTRRAMEHADAAQGQRNLWLRSLDRLGLGFDS